MTSTMTPRHVPSIESLRRMPSFNRTTANSSPSSNGAADNHPTQQHSTWTPSLATLPNTNAYPTYPAHHTTDPTLGMGMHRGAIDKTTITTQPPARVMAHVAGVLQAMGVEIQQESLFRFRCIRPSKVKQSGAGAVSQDASGHLAAPVPVAGSTLVANRCVSPFDDTRPLSPFDSPILSPSTTSNSLGTGTTFSFTPTAETETLYGSSPDDSQDEVRFSVELTRLEGLSGTYSLDIRRLKGNLRSYSFIYNTIRERAAINRL